MLNTSLHIILFKVEKYLYLKLKLRCSFVIKCIHFDGPGIKTKKIDINGKQIIQTSSFQCLLYIFFKQTDNSHYVFLKKTIHKYEVLTLKRDKVKYISREQSIFFIIHVIQI